MANDPLTTLEDVKRWLKIPVEEDGDDDLLNGLIQSCSQQIGDYCGRDNLGLIQTYQENRSLPNVVLQRANYAPRILLKRYPVVDLVSIVWNNNTLAILTAAQVQTQQAGVFLEDNNRTLTFLGIWMPPVYGYVQINYTAGYQLIGAEVSSQSTPNGLRQACNQWVGEIYKSTGWIGYRSKSLAGETVSFDMGAAWGMSPRTKAMLQPFVNRMPPFQ